MYRTQPCGTEEKPGYCLSYSKLARLQNYSEKFLLIEMPTYSHGKMVSLCLQQRPAPDSTLGPFSSRASITCCLCSRVSTYLCHPIYPMTGLVFFILPTGMMLISPPFLVHMCSFFLPSSSSCFSSPATATMSFLVLVQLCLTLNTMAPLRYHHLVKLVKGVPECSVLCNFQ